MKSFLSLDLKVCLCRPGSRPHRPSKEFRSFFLCGERTREARKDSCSAPLSVLSHDQDEGLKEMKD